MAARSSLVSSNTGELSAVDGLVQLSFLIQNSLSRLAGQHGVSLIQTRLLGILRDRTPSMNELAKLLELDKSSVTGLIDRAERRGFVERIPSEEDRRAVVVRLTKEGRSLVSKVGANFATEVSQMLDLLPAKDAAVLSRVISRLLIAHADEHGVNLFAGVTLRSTGRSRLGAEYLS
jgi:MarR family transcriptional regulator, lower aerobic nicotinate degradation pathway regulator